MRRAHEARLYALTTAAACGLALLAGVVGAPTRAVMQNLVFDQYQRWKPRPYAFDQPVRIVAIDDELLKRLGQWPWPRERLAALVDALKRAGVASVSFDFLFAEKDRGDATASADKTPDAAFAQSMDGGAVVLGSFVSELPSGASARQGGICHRRRRRREVPDAVAGTSVAGARVGAACGGDRLPQLAAGRRPGRATGAAHPQREWRFAAKSRHGSAAHRAGRVDLYRQVVQRQRRNRVRASLRRACDPQWRLDDPDRGVGRHQGLFRESGPAPNDRRMEGARTGSGSQRSSRRDCVLRRLRSAALGHRRDPVVAGDAGR